MKAERKALAGRWVCQSSEVNGVKRGKEQSRDQTFTFDGPGVYTIPVQLEVDFAFDAAAEQNDSKNATVNFTGVSFIATQTDATPADAN